MKENKEHNNLGAIDRQSKNFFTGGKFNWEKSNAEVWASIEATMKTQAKGRSLKFNFKASIYAVAASLLILIGIGSFLRFYTTTVATPAGQHLMAQLPDGSSVELNAESSIKYNPYWWRFSRSLEFEGEGLFEVEKGKKFTVISSKGITQVLGTSFNIFSREEVYKVTCLTGSVKVISKTKNEVVLEPNSKAEIQKDGKIEVQHNIEIFSEISWNKNIFLFTATPLREVFYEIERQYGINIKTNIDSYALYTGNFTREQNVEEILGYVCPALGLKYLKKSDSEYFIIQEDE